MTTRRDGQLSRENIVRSRDLRQGEPAVPVAFDCFDDGGAEVSSGDGVEEGAVRNAAAPSDI
jgi:hypothetical protein